MNRVNCWSARLVLLGTLLAVSGCSEKPQDPPDPLAHGSAREAPAAADFPPGSPGAREPEGLAVNDARAFRGYTLLAPILSTDTSLIDTAGNVVRTWRCGCFPALGATLLENGNLLRAGQLPGGMRPFDHPGRGGLVQEFNWDGDLVWDFRFCDDAHLPHHDAIKLPNGNVLLVVCERIPARDARDAGRRPDSFTGPYLLADTIVEIKPMGRTRGEVVWEWRAWDHIVQEHDRDKATHGSVADHPERIDLNFGAGSNGPIVGSGPDLAKLQALGYVGASTGPASAVAHPGDWTHLNAVAYNPELDQLALTSLGYSEVWIIDHSTTRAEAAGHTGGKSGKGGDLLYRWGNPRAYRHGTTSDQRLRSPHSAHWIGRGLPGAGHLLVFNNGAAPPTGGSSVEELDLPVDATGHYTRAARSAFGPEKAVWNYNGERKPEFYSPTFSGAQRLPNGNTLVCLGLPGTLVEVTHEGQVVWKYVLHAALPAPPPGAPFPGTVPWGPPLGAPVEERRALFRASRYAPDHPGLVGKDLAPKPAP